MNINNVNPSKMAQTPANSPPAATSPQIVHKIKAPNPRLDLPPSRPFLIQRGLLIIPGLEQDNQPVMGLNLPN
jgi:hypothetical protein